MGKHYSEAVKLEAVRLFGEGKSHGEITEALGIRDEQRTKKWVRAYLESGADAFEKKSKKWACPAKTPTERNWEKF